MSLTNIDRIEADLNGQDLCIGIVQARFNAPICEALTEACVKELLALGAVIRGETYHFELVSNESGAGISRVGLDYGIPIANGVLTCETDEQAQARVLEKGRDCARTAVEMANLSIGLTPDDEVEED
jgi:6,7-dimethyl-8-ribityllumazine synthase